MTDVKEPGAVTRCRSFAEPCPYVKTVGLLLNHTESNEIVSYIDTLTRERDAAREAFYTVASTYCEHLHHTKKDYHKSGEPCPVEARIKTLIQIIEENA